MDDPAAMCGPTGLKPTPSRVSRAGVMPLSWTLDCVGPIARTARDCARLLAAIAGEDAADPTSSNAPVPDYESMLDGDLTGVRIAVPRGYYHDHVNPEVAAALAASRQVLREHGAENCRDPRP